MKIISPIPASSRHISTSNTPPLDWKGALVSAVLFGTWFMLEIGLERLIQKNAHRKNSFENPFKVPFPKNASKLTLIGPNIERRPADIFVHLLARKTSITISRIRGNPDQFQILQTSGEPRLQVLLEEGQTVLLEKNRPLLLNSKRWMISGVHYQLLEID